MSQEISILLLVDIDAAIDDNSLESNVYMIDNLRTEGSINECSGNLVTAVNGTHWQDGTQAGEIIINWLISTISCLPPALPRNYHSHRSKMIENNALHNIHHLHSKQDIETVEDIKSRYQSIMEEKGHSAHVIDARGEATNTGLVVMDVYGDPYHPGESKQSDLSHQQPVITNITGEAVELGVIFPVQLGTPVVLKDGWYWCATADSGKTGTYKYTIHITLFKLKYANGIASWEPVKMTWDSQLKVTSEPKRNGFTKGAMSFLPFK